uniref:NADH-ubiquinone oxidoreductase chain 5 n=1 Tax=Amphiascoides atopus TaxID=1352461 RepID=W8DNA0_9MAXI|nr:NADH dehydrogenase subunit 5 [Amphiascoides atopus]AHB52771.1 NADH dehydrogenase subunit 5 [Amphiascoides atopus]
MLKMKNKFSLISSVILATGTLLTSVLFLKSGSLFSAIFLEVELLKIEGLALSLVLILDVYSLSFLISVLLISSCVIMFSSSYMAAEKFFTRFHLLVLSFVTAMGLLIFSPNMLSVLLGWDGLGLTSYLLVVYFQSSKSYNAGMLTALSNRIGDVLILTSIASASFTLGWNFILHSHGNLGFSITLILILLAACTKSAQIPFSAWLPAAMAAPTPVSALVHSSTLVTAGIYLLFRFQPALSELNLACLVMIMGSATMFMAGISAMFEMDMKKIVALSTLSQLGVMMTTLGAGMPVTAFLHLLAHAFFKALLFISVGSMIHLSSDYQDLRKVGTAIHLCPLTLSLCVLANLSLCGLPFCSGFYSKDLCIELFVTNTFHSPLSLIFFLATLMTCAYTARFLFMVSFLGSRNTPLLWSNDKDLKILNAMLGLAPLALTGGGLLTWLLMPSPLITPLTSPEKNSTLLVVVSGLFLGILLVIRAKKYMSPNLVSLSSIMWALPLLSSRAWTSTPFMGGHSFRVILDFNWVPSFTTSFVTPLVSKSLIVNRLDTNILFLSLTAVPVLILLFLY